MLDPQDIIDQINDDLRNGDVTVPMFVNVWISDDNFGPYVCHRFFDDKERLVSFLFDMSLSKKIFMFGRVHGASEIAVNGYDDAVIGYELHVSKCGERENESNLTSELIGKLASLFDIDELMKFGRLKDEEIQDG